MANLHITGCVVGGGLDWLGSRKWREKSNPEVAYLFKYDWQIDANIRFTRLKDMAVLIPMWLASWCYFIWRIWSTM